MINALFGYTYQHSIAYLFLSIMDVERTIDEIELEASVDHKFDDIALCVADKKYFIQIKDIEGITLDDLSVSSSELFINGKPHKLSDNTNLVFFKTIKLKTNSKILGFSAYMFNGIYLISINREQIEKRVNKLYRSSVFRRSVIQHFLSEKLDSRNLKIERKHLPSITLFDNRLVEKNIKISRQILKFEHILLMEGKPGVGKSHLVSYIQQQFKSNVLYRFWVSNQDRQYEQRLRYTEFKAELSKKLFFDLIERSEEQLFEKFSIEGITLIIDGLDHVENYRNVDLQNFIDFIDRAKAFCKVIVLSRPLKKTLSWKKQVLRNWNCNQTKKLLKDLYHIEEHTVFLDIYKLTNGYPILVKYIAEQYKKEGTIPEFANLDTVDKYYDNLLKDQSGKRALTLFLCCRGYLMRSELSLFLGALMGSIIEEFIDERPYLFEMKLNRISLYHDSLITYLRNNGLDFLSLLEQVNNIVTKSLLNNETRFQSRIAHFELSQESEEAVIRKYSSISNFKTFIKKVVDFEAVNEFYNHVREILCRIDPNALNIQEYYDLSLIINLTVRDHISSNNGFYFTYTSLLLHQGYSEEDITSSNYLFGTLLYLKSQDGSFLYNIKDDQHYDTLQFYDELQSDISKEKNFFKYQSKPFSEEGIKRALKKYTDYKFNELLKDILINVYIHPIQQNRFVELYTAVQQYLQGEESKAAMTLYHTLRLPKWKDYQFSWVLREVKPTLLALGIDPENNDYLNLSLKDYLQKNKNKGSFTLWPEVLSYLRLALHDDRKIDISSVSIFWTKYHQRKDYSLFSLDYALTVFEEKGFVNWKNSVKLILQVQDISEKGYRWLLGGYLMLHPPEFIKNVLNEFDLNSLRIEWFHLGYEHINVLPDEVYYKELYEQFHYHRSHPQIDISNIVNLLFSNRLENFKTALSDHGFSIALKKDDSRKTFLEEHQIPFVILTEERSYNSDKSPETRFAQGVLDMDNQFLILEKELQPEEVALFVDADQTALANPEIYRQFRKSKLQENMKKILFNTLTGKSGYSNYFNLAWVLPGTIPQLLSDSQTEVNFKHIFESFINYLELSMFELESTTEER